jgi:GT2 family glycosyltransferase
MSAEDRPIALDAPAITPEFFDEISYLRENPDVASAIARGEVPSGYIHYLKYGMREGRSSPMSAEEPRNRLIRTAPASMTETNRDAPHHFETLMVSRGGGVLVIGWIDDAADPINHIRVFAPGWRITLGGEALGRVRRFDVEEALGSGVMHPYGYYGFVFADEPIGAVGACEVEITLRSGRKMIMPASARLIEDIELRDQLLSYVCNAQHFGAAHIKAIEGFDRGAGHEILKLNHHITRQLVATPYVERFGRQDAIYDGSIIVCLYGKAEFLFLQAALYGAVPGIGRYELIYVSNSPELAETLLREAQAATLIYGVDITVVLLSGNAGFGAANNAAAAVARSDRIMIVNPDVLPMDKGFADRHSALLAGAPKEQTRMFGAALYYDDGSLMHGGMYFELDSAVSLERGRHRVCQLIRVEHYGKGTPAQMDVFTRPRPVPALTGAFISCERGWFERLGGFTEDYVFGHYEDADLCLKSLRAGSRVWMQDLPLWHLEGKGSTRLPVHEGGSLVNRWLFSSTWGADISDNLLGPRPAHPAFGDDPKAYRPPVVDLSKPASKEGPRR